MGLLRLQEREMTAGFYFVLPSTHLRELQERETTRDHDTQELLRECESYATASPTQALVQVLREHKTREPREVRIPRENAGPRATRDPRALPRENASLSATRDPRALPRENADLSATRDPRALPRDNADLSTTYRTRELPPTTRESYYYHARLMRITTTTHGRMTVSSQNPRERDIRELKVNPRALV